MKTYNRFGLEFAVAAAVCLTGCDKQKSGAGHSGADTEQSTNSVSATNTNESAPSAGHVERFDARSGSKMRLGGSSALHDWQAEARLIAGFVEVGPNFPTEPGQTVTPGKVEAHGEASVNVRSLQSIHKDGAHYDDKMDQKMWEMLLQEKHPKITYHLSELVLKVTPQDKGSPYIFESQGDLTVAGVTRKLSMPVNVIPLGETKGDKRVKISGSAALKMSDFNISPAKILFVKTADELTAKFEWVVGHKATAAGTGASK
jgi:polyisoprenoid-binding protein YceI